MIYSIILVIGGFFLLVKGADWFVAGAATLANKWGIPHMVIGLTIVAMGTSLPEAAVSIAAAMNHSAGISVGNVVGSNIMNILIVLGVTAVIAAMPVEKDTIRKDIPFLIGVTILMAFFGYTGGQIVRAEGIVFAIVFLIYLAYLAIITKKNNPPEEGEDEYIHDGYSVTKCMIILFLGGVMTIVGSKLIVFGATDVAETIGISDRIIGLTVIAFGTSLPELVTCIVAARQGNSGIAIGNIIGSNIFNILFVLGATSIITTVPFEMKFMFDTVVALAAILVLWASAFRNGKVGRKVGYVMLAIYVAYSVMQFAVI